MSFKSFVNDLESSAKQVDKTLHEGLGLYDSFSKNAGAFEKKTAISVLNSDISTVASVAEFLPNGQVKGKDIAGIVKDVTGKKLSGTAGEFLNSLDTITKNGDQFSAQRAEATQIKIGKSVGSGVSVDSLDIGKNLSFTLGKGPHGESELKNLKGITVSVGTPIGEQTLPITAIDVTKDKNGKSVFTATVDTPQAGQILLGEGNSIPVSIQFDENGKPHVINKSQIKGDAVSSSSIPGAITKQINDTGNFFSNPSLGGAGQLAVDSANTIASPFVTLGNGIGSLFS